MPLAAQINTASLRVTAWRPGDPANPAAGPVLPWPPDDPIDPVIEREPPTVHGPGLRQRAEAGALLVAALAEAGLDARARLVQLCPLFNPGEAQQAPRRFAALALSCPDGERAAALLESGAAGIASIAGTTEAARAAAQAWLVWYRDNVSRARPGAPESWIPERLEHRFSLRLGSGPGQRVVVAPS